MPMLTRKRKLNPVPYSKKRRSKIPRRKRLHVFPIIAHPYPDSNFHEQERELTAFPAGSCSSTCFSGDLSCISDKIFAGSKNVEKKSTHSGQKVGTEKPPENEVNGVSGVSFSATSCLESFSEVNDEISGRFDEYSKNTKSRPKSPENEEKTARLASSCLESFSRQSVKEETRSINWKSVNEDEPLGIEVSESSCFGSVQNISNSKQLNRVENDFDKCCSEAVVERLNDDSTPDLACSEELSSADSDYCAQLESILSELESESFPTPLSDESLELSSSFPYLDSSEDFSENRNSNSIKSACFAQFLQHSKTFYRSSYVLGSENENKQSEDFILLQFEDKEHEESYLKFKSRERRHAYLHDYVESYSSTEHDDLVFNLRLQMVSWIFEHVSTNDLQWETLFLGVSLLDRFLCKGFFKNESLLQILGIACVTLATRIEENQPQNCIRQKNFQVGSNIYSRREVVAMEWLVQEVLSFQCFLPTTFNFLGFYLKAVKAEEQIEMFVKCLAVLSLFDHEIVRFFPSTVAAGLVVLACLLGNEESTCHGILEAHVRTRKDDLFDCIESLEWLVDFLEK